MRSESTMNLRQFQRFGEGKNGGERKSQGGQCGCVGGECGTTNKKNQAVFVCNSLIFSGIPGGARTHDPLIKSQLLYQLSYGNIPIIFACKGTKKMSVASTIWHFFRFCLKISHLRRLPAHFL